jgi:UDP-glucose 4-epimerase
LLLDEAGGGSMRFVAWPEEQRRIDIGSFWADSSKFQRTTGWAPSVALDDGLRRTLAYYRAHAGRYLDPATAVP